MKKFEEEFPSVLDMNRREKREPHGNSFSRSLDFSKIELPYSKLLLKFKEIESEIKETELLKKQFKREDAEISLA